ncbi:AAA family ATPase [bacterium]|jgi:SpoVK/Ycf46/Vps4 family AAA+-type ATPase|nr:AAA family ATPase [bacterium]MBT5015468.1 AAA family ATPase [bacterium]
MNQLVHQCLFFLGCMVIFYTFPECRVKDLYGTFPSKFCSAFEEMKRQKRVKETHDDYQPIRDPQSKRLYSRIVLSGESGTSKRIAVKAKAEEIGAHIIIRNASSLLTEYLGSQEITNLKEQALNLHAEDGKHVVVLIVGVEAIIANTTLDPSSTAYTSFHNASQELWSLLTDFEDDPRLSFVMTAENLDDADPQFLSRVRGRTTNFSKPDAKSRKEFLQNMVRQREVDPFELFVEEMSTSPIMHQAYVKKELGQALNFKLKKSWMGLGTAYIANQSYQETHQTYSMAVSESESAENFKRKIKGSQNLRLINYSYAELKTMHSSLEKDPQQNNISKIIKIALLHKLGQFSENIHSSNFSEDEKIKIIHHDFNEAILSHLVAETQGFSYQDLTTMSENIARNEEISFSELSYICMLKRMSVQAKEQQQNQEKLEKSKADENKVKRLSTLIEHYKRQGKELHNIIWDLH